MNNISVMRVFTIWLALSSTWGLAAAPDDSEAPDAVRSSPDVRGALRTIDAWLEGVQIYQRIPGLSAGLVHGSDLIWQGSYGLSNLATKRPADVDTLYSICSISKLFTSIAVLQLRDAGKLSLRDPVDQHLEWFDIHQNFPDRGPVTIEGLLTHSSGLPREADFPYWNAPDFVFPTREQIIERLAEQSTLYPSRDLFQYSNLALTLAGEIVQEVSGQPYAEYVQQHILDPLRLENTRSRYPDELRGEQLAVGYSGIHRGGTRDEVAPFFTRGITAAAGFTSSVRDLARFAGWQFRLLEAGGDEVLSANTLREMQRVHWVDPDWKVTWGLGFEVQRRNDMTFVGHGGSCPGYQTSLAMVPNRRIAAIVLTNAGDAPAENLAINMLRVVAKGLDAAPEAEPEMLPDLARYEGNYEVRPWGGEVAVRQWGDELALFYSPSNDLMEALFRLRRVDGDRFVRIDDEGKPREPWVFEGFEGGRATRIFVHSIYWSRIDPTAGHPTKNDGRQD
jgi:CubicO group peptidase (beta-lactamase class C family)